MKKQFVTAVLVILSFSLHAQTPMEANAPWKFDAKNLIALPSGTVQRAFNAVKNSGIEFRYPQGGCQQRAEMMHAVLSHYSVPHARVFIFAPKDLIEGDNTNLEVTDLNGLSPNNIIRWPYHVAPLVSEIGADGNPKLMVIDPALDSNIPLALKDWFAKMKNADVSQYAIVAPDSYFFYTKGSSTVVSGDFYKYEDLPNSAIISTFDNAILEREIALNDVAIFLKKRLDDGYADPQNEIRGLLSSVNSMVGLFASQNNTIQIQGITIRDLLDHHADLINQAMKYYAERVTFWMKTYKELYTQKPVQLQARQQLQPRQGRGMQQLQESKRSYKKK